MLRDMVESVILLNDDALLMGGSRCFRRLFRCRPYFEDLAVVSVTVENRLIVSSSESKKLVVSKSLLIMVDDSYE